MKHILLFLLCVSVVCSRAEAAHGPINNALLDLRAMPLHQIQDGLDLTGGWGFYWMQGPDDIVKASNMDVFQVPKTWKGNATVMGKPLSGVGYACYTLRILLPHGSGSWVLTVPGVLSAYRLYANQKLIAENGVPGRDKGSTVPQWKPLIVGLNPTDTLDLVWEVANFHHVKGGVPYPIRISGEPSAIQAKSMDLISAFVQVFSLFSVGVIFILLYFLYHREKTYFYFSLFALDWGIRAFFTPSFFFIGHFTTLTWMLSMRIEYLTLVFGILLACLFIDAVFPRDGKKWFGQMIKILILIYVLCIAIASPSFFTSLLPLFQGTGVGVSLYISIVVFRAMALKRPGATFMGIGIMALLFVSIYDLLIFYQDLPLEPQSVHYGYGLVVLCIAAGLANITRDHLRELEQEKARVSEKVQATSLELRKAMHHLTKAKYDLEEMNRMKTIFLANLSHEFRTPLNGMMGIAEIMSQNVGKPSYTAFEHEKGSNILDQKTKDLSQIFKSVGEFHNISKGEEGLLPVRGNLYSFLEKIKHQFYNDHDLQSKELDFKWENEIPLNCFIEADFDKLEKVLAHLFHNAVKFTSTGTIVIRIDLMDREVVFSVSDTGIGIPEGKGDSIFAPYRQGEEGMSRTYGGLGLGLAICGKFVSMWQGTIQISKNGNGIGTRAWFTLPLQGNIPKNR